MPNLLLLELDNLSLSGAYADDDWDLTRGSEEVVEIAPDEYVDHSVWDDGFLEIDDRGREVTIPETARLIVRLLRGKILLVTKGSMWNGVPATYNGVHDKMTAAEIRDVIERVLQSA